MNTGFIKKEILTSDRIVLMSLREKDRDIMINAIKDKRVNETYMLPDFSSVEEENVFFKHLMELSKDVNRFIYGIYYNDSFIGFINEVDKKEDEIELGYFIIPSFWNQNFATEALNLAIKSLFEMGYKKILAAHFEENPVSGKVMQKARMIKLKKEDEIEYKGKKHKCIYYGIKKIDVNKYNPIIGDKIILRKANDNDYESMFKNVWNDKEVYKWMYFGPTNTIEEAIERNKKTILFQQNLYAYYIALKDTNVAIGLCGIYEYEEDRFQECSICVGKEYQGNGIGNEVLSILLDLAFNKLNAIDFRYSYFIDNVKSINLAKKYHFEPFKKEEIIRPWDKEKKTIIYCLLSKEEYIKNNNKKH